MTYDFESFESRAIEVFRATYKDYADVPTEDLEVFSSGEVAIGSMRFKTGVNLGDFIL